METKRQKLERERKKTSEEGESEKQGMDTGEGVRAALRWLIMVLGKGTHHDDECHPQSANV